MRNGTHPDSINARSPERATDTCAFLLTLTYIEVANAEVTKDGVGTWYPRSENPDLGHPGFVAQTFAKSRAIFPISASFVAGCVASLSLLELDEISSVATVW